MIKNYLYVKKIGNFYNVYEDDAVILHHLFKYKIIKSKQNAGFPISAFNKVINTLDDKKISYKIFEKDNLVMEKDYDNINNYNKILKEGNDKLEEEIRLDRIENKIKNMNIDEIGNLLDVIENAIQ